MECYFKYVILILSWYRRIFLEWNKIIVIKLFIIVLIIEVIVVKDYILLFLEEVLFEFVIILFFFSKFDLLWV